MYIRIETYGTNKYDELMQDYGSVLTKYHPVKVDNKYMYIYIKNLKDLFELDKELRNFVEEHYKYNCYFGIIIKQDEDGNPMLEIKDNWD